MSAFSNSKRTILVSLVMFAVLFISMASARPYAMAQPSSDSSDADSPALEFNSLGDLAGKRIAVMSGTVFDQLVLDHVEGVTQDDISYFNSAAETIGALKAGKVDAAINDSPLALLAVNNNEGIGILPEYVVNDRYAFVLPKGSDLTPKINCCSTSRRAHSIPQWCPRCSRS